MAEDIELELTAIKTIVQTLEPLRPEVRTRVIDHAFKVLGIEAPSTIRVTSPLEASVPSLSPPISASKSHIDGPTDVLSLKEEKGPKTATEMIAIVAYYLAHLADERRDVITQDDIQKYFVQGRYPMPGSKSQALVNAKNAGYLDFIEPGKYRLNSVGYNLVAHKMPRDASVPNNPRGTTRKATPKKSATKSKK